MTKNEKKALYESIMKQSAQLVNKKLNEDIDEDGYDDLSYLKNTGDVRQDLQACVGSLETATDIEQMRDDMITAIKAIYKGFVFLSEGKKFFDAKF